MGLNFEALRREGKRLTSQNTDWKERYVKMPEGEGSVTVRLLPPEPGEEAYVATRLHKIDGKNYHSLLELNPDTGRWEGDCPLYNEYRAIWKEIEKLERAGKMDAARDLRTLAGQIRPMERYYWKAIVRKEVKENGETATDVGPKVLSVGKELHTRVVNAIIGNEAMDDPGYGDVTDFTTGRDFRIRKKLRKGVNISYPEYNDSSFLAPSVAGTDAQWKTWTDKLIKLKDERKLKSAEELQEVLDVFLGRKEAPAGNSYSPSSAPSKAPEVQKPVVQKVVTNVAAQQVAPVVEDEGVDDDFIAELRNM